MKKVLLALPFLVSSHVYAAQCKVDLKNEIHLSGDKLEIHQVSGDTAIVDADNNVTIHGERIELNSEQKQAVSEYRESLNEYLPRAKQIAQDGLALANEIVDDVAESFDAPEAFEGVKTSMKEFYADVEARYYKNGDLILPADSFSSLADTWTEDLEKATALFNEEFITSAFGVMSEKMKQEGGLNLTEMANSMSELKERIENRIKEHQSEVEQQSEEFCDSLDDIAEQEQELHKKIPQLKDYQVFTI
ncbi:YggN family protein [Vibrio atypicus]|uniref:YggN family protein n=1 Tax=Vibrio atypicus TaxID=558271 RepID=UPI001357DB94|nr:YggN family protein [Vibrio atypicus]